MSTFRLTIDLGNAAFYDEHTGEFDPYREVARILDRLSESVGASSIRTDFPLRDINGNHVGDAEFDIETPVREPEVRSDADIIEDEALVAGSVES